MRKEKGLSLRRAAEGAEISVAYVSRLEANDANPTLEVLEKLAKLYGVPLEELTAGTRETSSPLQLAPALVEFLKAYEDSFPELKDPDWQRTLSNLRLRGRYPEKKEDWLSLFLELRRALQ
jgi:transcriptional regulator with XRE-family HTH domain